MNKRTFIKSIAATFVTVGLSLSLIGQAAAADVKVVKVGVVGDYNDQWETVNELLAKDNIRVKLVKFSDYATPNRALADGDLDLNAFQHKAFLANDIARNGYKIVAIGDTIITPLRIYNNKDKIKSLADIKDGAVIAIPSDLTNGGRAIKLLEKALLRSILLRVDVGLEKWTSRFVKERRKRSTCCQLSFVS